MPIANCFLKNKDVEIGTLHKIVHEWAAETGIESRDISINFIKDFVQEGQKYAAMVNLYLPSLWEESNIHNIQIKLLNLLVKHLNIPHDQVFIITAIVQSGHVVENGDIVTW